MSETGDRQVERRRRGRPTTINREAVLDATAHVVAERGATETRYRDITDESGVPTSTLQSAFGTLGHLISEAMGRASRLEIEHVAEIAGPDAGDAPTRMRNLTAYCAGPECPREGRLFWFEYWRRGYRNAEYSDQMHEFNVRWIDAVSAIIDDGVAAGDFQIGRPSREVADLVLAIFDGLAATMIAPATGRRPELAESLALDALWAILGVSDGGRGS